jgi:hypothetical protein
VSDLDELLELKSLAENAEGFLRSASFNRLWNDYIDMLKETMVLSTDTANREYIHAQYQGALGFLEFMNGTVANWANNEDNLKEFEFEQKIDNN